MERFTAKALQGHRIPRGANFSRSLPDVIAKSEFTLARSNGLLYAECKYSSKSTWVNKFESVYEGKLLHIYKGSTKFIFFPLEDIHLLSDPRRYRSSVQVKGSIPKYINTYIEQSRNYIKSCREDPITKASLAVIVGRSPEVSILPIVVIGQRYKSFRLVYTTDTDLNIFYSLQNDQSYRSI